MRTTNLFVAGLAALVPTLLASSVLAQPTPTFTYGKADEVAEVKGVEWTAAADAGILLTTGNAETVTITAGAKATRKSGNNKLEAAVSGALARSGLRVATDVNNNGTISEDELTNQTLKTAETITGKLRYDRFLTDKNSLYLAALALRDVPAGKEFAGGAQLGYSRTLKKTETREALGEFGVDYTYEDLVAPGDPLQIFSLRAFIGYKATLGTATTLDTSLEALSNLNTLDTPTGEAKIFEDLRLNGQAAIATKIGDDLSFSVSIGAKYDNVPAPLALAGVVFDPGFVPESAKLDTIFKASLIYTLF
jgi:hypothetical protein